MDRRKTVKSMSGYNKMLQVVSISLGLHKELYSRLTKGAHYTGWYITQALQYMY